MAFSSASYDSGTLSLLEQAFHEAWGEVQLMNPAQTGNMATTRKMMALRIMDAVKNGERDPARLRQLAIQAVEGRDFG